MGRTEKVPAVRPSAVRRFRHWLHHELDPRSRRRGLSPINRVLIAAIIVSVVVALIETERTIYVGREHYFRWLELGFVSLFTVEYVARFWTAAEEGGWRARLRWMHSPAALIDLMAIIPALLTITAGPTLVLRLARLLRILRVAKLGRFSRSWDLARRAIMSRRHELALGFYAAILVMIVSSTLLYAVEGPGQPEKFGSIPRAMWWSVVTLTTIGYGDVFPVTGLGRFLAACTAVLGIGLIAVPTGILAAAFSDAMRHHDDEAEDEAETRD